mmetsp:Transcript_18458/g.50678  ORF Transcript_18458/g.50678 Transcript_18458/m.50678 type:complete len:204 (+) Transcript_18458:381-992(+)
MPPTFGKAVSKSGKPDLSCTPPKVALKLGMALITEMPHANAAYKFIRMKNLWLPIPTQLPTHGQWWSMRLTHLSQTEQWCARSGLASLQRRHLVCAPGCQRRADDGASAKVVRRPQPAGTRPGSETEQRRKLQKARSHATLKATGTQTSLDDAPDVQKPGSGAPAAFRPKAKPPRTRTKLKTYHSNAKRLTMNSTGTSDAARM